MSNSNLTDKEAFLAMYSFLQHWYEMTKSDDIGSLLGSMSLLEDGRTADPAIESDWLKAIEKALEGEVNAGLVLKESSDLTP